MAVDSGARNVPGWVIVTSTKGNSSFSHQRMNAPQKLRMSGRKKRMRPRSPNVALKAALMDPDRSDMAAPVKYASAEAAVSDARPIIHPRNGSESASAMSVKKAKKIVHSGRRLKTPAVAFARMICHAVRGVERSTSHCLPSFSRTKSETPEPIAIRRRNAVMYQRNVGCQIFSERAAEPIIDRMRKTPRRMNPIHVALLNPADRRVRSSFQRI